jgi:hypothetical protein
MFTLTLQGVGGDGFGQSLDGLWVATQGAKICGDVAVISLFLQQQTQLFLVGHHQTHRVVLIALGAYAHLTGKKHTM